MYGYKFSWKKGYSNPLNLTPPSSDEETPRRHAMPSTRRTGKETYGSYGSSNGGGSRARTYTDSSSGSGSLRRQAAVSSARQSDSSRARSHSSRAEQSSSTSYSGSNPAFHGSALRHMNSFEAGSPYILNRTRQFEPQSGTDLSSFGSSYGSYGRESSTRRNGSTRNRADSYDLSSAEGMPDSLYRAGERRHFNTRRYGSYFGSSDDYQKSREETSKGKSSLSRAFGDSSSDDE